MKHSVDNVHLSVACVLLSCSAAAQASTGRVEGVNIQQQPILGALREFVEQTGVQLLIAGDTVPSDGVIAQPVVGEYPLTVTLDRMLTDTGLTYEFVNARTVRIWRAPLNYRAGAGGSERVSVEGGGSREGPIAEVIVSAQKRSERLQDVPVSVTAIKADDLVAQGQLRLQDYYSTVPSLNVSPRNQSGQAIEIRGISAQASVLVDDSPYNASTGFGGSGQVPDIDPSELARIEVLRGPQGTLYGASSMSGIVKFVTIDPSTDAFSASAKAGMSSVKHGDGTGYNVRLSANVPVNEEFAFLASGFTHEDPGYIDNPVLGEQGVNQQRVNGGRLAGLWQPSSAVSVKLSALYQLTKGDGANESLHRNNLAELQQDYIAGTGAYSRRAQAYSASLAANLGNVNMIAVSGYNLNSISDSFDFSYALGALNNGVFHVSGAPVFNDIRSKKFTQEIRLTGGSIKSLEWLAGAFYTDERSHFEQNVRASVPTTGQIVGTGLTLLNPSTYRDTALFADVTWHFTERFDMQFGVRESWINQTSQQTEIGPFTPIFTGGKAQSPAYFPEVKTDDSVFTYLVTPTFKFTPDSMVYARLATGYRAGAPNLAPVNIPEMVNPDTTLNYEIGFKSDFFDRKLSIDASAFYIKWKDIQTGGGVNPATGLTWGYNAGRAKSEGLELSVNFRPAVHTSISGWITVDGRAELTETTKAGTKGDKITGTPYSGNLSLQQDFMLANDMQAFVGATLSYVGDRKFELNGKVTRDHPPYAKTNLRGGLKFSSWSTSLYVNNVTDRRGIISGGPGFFPPFGYYYVQPRAIGLDVTKSF